MFAIIIAASVAMSAFFFTTNSEKIEPILPQPTSSPDTKESCTTDAKICPDGSVVGRTAPNCEFAACPKTASPSANNKNKMITVIGTMICLPHKDTNGSVQTMECAFGLNGDNGKNYGLTDPGWKYLIGAPMNIKVKITGVLTEKEDLKYDSVGTIEITNLEKL